MKKISFESGGQNVFVTFTNHNGRVITELYCIATGEKEANKIVQALTFAWESDNTFFL